MRKLVFSAVALILFLGWENCVIGAEKTVKIKTVAVIPFISFDSVNFSVDVTSLIVDKLKKYGFNVIAQEQLENFLIKRRIRRVNFLDRATIREIGFKLKADALIIGSVDILAEGDNPQVFMDAQMVDCYDASVVWARSISRAGTDFESVLGLGRITSLNKLVEVVCKELLQDLPDSAKADNTSLAPFEIIYAGFSPAILKGGETVRICVEVNQISGRIYSINAHVLDRDVELKSEDGRLYTGMLTAPSLEGIYSLKIYVTDKNSRIYRVDNLASLIVDNSPPEVELQLRNGFISPNNDGVNDYALLIPMVDKAFALQGWRVEVTNNDGTVVRCEEDLGALPEAFVWRGENNQFEIVKEGNYYFRLILQDKAGNRAVTPGKKIVVDRTAPEVSVVLVKRTKNSLVLWLNVTDISPITYWEVIVYDESGIEIANFTGKGSLPSTLTCIVKKKLEPESSLTYSLEVRDAAGNRLQVKKQFLKWLKVKGSPHEKKTEIWVDDF